MDYPSVMHSAVADQYQADENRHGPSPASYFTGPAAHQIQNPQHIFMNYPEPVPLRPGSGFQPLRARNKDPDIDLLALQPAPQTSTPGMYPTSNNYFQAGTQELNSAYDMHRSPTYAEFNGYPQPSPNAWYSQPLPNVAGASFQGMPAGQASHQDSPQYPQAYGSIDRTASLEMLGNQAPQHSVNTNGAAPWGTFSHQTPHEGYHPSANLFLATPQQSLVNQSFVNTTGTAPQALQPSVGITGVASGGTIVGRTPCQSHYHYLSNNTASTAPQKSAVNQLSQPSVNITKVALRGRSFNQAARKRSPQVPPQALQSSVNAIGAASQGTRGNQTPPGSQQPSVNTAATGLQKSPDCQPSKPLVESTGAAHCETFGSQSSHESHQSVTDRAVATLKKILDEQNSQHSVSATETAPQEKSVSQTSLGSQQPSTTVAVAAPQKSPVNQTSQLSVDTTEATTQGGPVSQASHGSHQQSTTNTAVTTPQELPVSQLFQLPASITEAATQGEPVSQASHGSHQPSTNTAVTTPVSQLFRPPAVITGAAHQRPLRRNGLEVHSRIHGSQVNGVRKSTPTRPASCPPTPPAEDMLKNNGCTSWEADMARHLHKSNVMGLFKVGDSLCDVLAASGDFVKLAKRDITPDGEHFWCHTMLGQRIRPIDTEYLNGKMVCLSNGAFVGMEDSQGNMITPKWQFTDPVDLESNSYELKDQSDFKPLITFEELIDQSMFNEPKDQGESEELKNQSKPKLSKNQIEFRRLQEVLKKRGAAFKKEAEKRETETLQGLKPGCDPMWF